MTQEPPDVASFDVVRGKIPPELLAGLEVNFTDEEIEKIHAKVNKISAPPADKPCALWVFGPSAVGKSALGSAKANELFGCEQKAVIIDGACFRTHHAGWQAVALHGLEHGCLHADAWPIFKDAGRKKHHEASKAEGKAEAAANGWSGQLKRQLLHEALRDRQHVMIPDCANHPDRLQAMIEEVKAAGYAMHALCLWAPLGVTRRRGEQRAVREGKAWAAKEYSKSTEGSLALAMRWIDGLRDEPASYRSLELWDNTHFPPSEVGLEGFARLVAMGADESTRHAESVTCSAQNQARSDPATRRQLRFSGRHFLR